MDIYLSNARISRAKSSTAHQRERKFFLMFLFTTQRSKFPVNGEYRLFDACVSISNFIDTFLEKKNQTQE